MGENRLDQILRFARQDVWSGTIPTTPDSLRFAAESLLRQIPIETADQRIFEKFLEKNKRVSALFNTYDARTVGFAIRAARMAR